MYRQRRCYRWHVCTAASLSFAPLQGILQALQLKFGLLLAGDIEGRNHHRRAERVYWILQDTTCTPSGACNPILLSDVGSSQCSAAGVLQSAAIHGYALGV